MEPDTDTNNHDYPLVADGGGEESRRLNLRSRLLRGSGSVVSLAASYAIFKYSSYNAYDELLSVPVIGMEVSVGLGSWLGYTAITGRPVEWPASSE